MLFSSMIFLWVFLPIVIIINYSINLISKDAKLRIHLKNVFLLVSSFAFYAWGGIYFLSIMLSSIIINFAGGYIISNFKDEAKGGKRITLIITILLNLLILFYFKYFNMVIVVMEQLAANPNDVLKAISNIFNMERTGSISFKEIVLPIGISFFTFQAMSYVIDVYKKNAEPQKSILDFGLYVALFPQLIAGPIVKYSDIASQINNRTESFDNFVAGIKRFCYGIGKKVIIANTMAEIVDEIWNLDLTNIGSLLAIVGMFAYTLQIYYDFSGYSDMAIGLGKMFGFTFKENFNYPYMSLSIIEFWRRWHISLSSWFKEYVYIPLGGNKKGEFRTCLNIVIVFLLTGIWHGANWTFILWGVIYAIFQIIERVFLEKKLKKNKFKFVNWLYTFIIVNLLWILFRANKISDAITYYTQIFSINSKFNLVTFLSMKKMLVFVVGILCFGILQKIFRNLYFKIKNNIIINILDFVLQILILIYSLLLITSGTYNPFIYFQF